jgi:hypothetical protein
LQAPVLQLDEICRFSFATAPDHLRRVTPEQNHLKKKSASQEFSAMPMIFLSANDQQRTPNDWHYVSMPT